MRSTMVTFRFSIRRMSMSATKYTSPGTMSLYCGRLSKLVRLACTCVIVAIGDCGIPVSLFPDSCNWSVSGKSVSSMLCGEDSLKTEQKDN